MLIRGVVVLALCLGADLFASPLAGANMQRLSISVDAATLVYPQNFPDPSVLVVGQKYFAYSTNSGGENLPVIESADLVHWKLLGDAMSVLPLWATAGTAWSPSVSAAPDGGYEVFFSAFDQAVGVRCLGRATSRSPFGPFVDISGRPFLCQHAAGGSIDPSIYQTPSGDYLQWKSDGEGGQPQEILSARLGAGDTELVGQPAVLLEATQPWEDGIVEGPALVDISGTLDLFFSANQWSTAQYSLGAATCASPLGPCEASSIQQISIPSSPGTGAGGPSFFAVDGRTYMAFAAWLGGQPGTPSGQRALFLMGLESETGIAVFNAATPVVARHEIPRTRAKADRALESAHSQVATRPRFARRTSRGDLH